MANDALNDINIVVGGDISPLQAAFDAIPAAAETAAKGVESALSELDAAFGTVEQQAKQFSDTIGQLGGAGGGATDLNNLNAALRDTGSAAESAVVPIKEMKPALDQAAEATDSFSNQIIKLGAGVLTFAALKGAIEEVVSAFGDLEASQIAITAMTGDAQAAADAIDMIQKLANQLGQSQDALINAQQRFVAIGVSLQDIPHLMEAAADAAAAANIPFSNVAGVMERMAESGKLATRALSQFRIDIADVGEAMDMAGASSKVIQDSFAGIGTAAERADVLATAFLNKFPDQANAAADGVRGAWQRIKNDSEDAFQDIGRALNGFKGLTDVIGPAIKGLSVDMIAVIGVIKLVVDALVSMGGQVVEFFTGVGTAVGRAATGNFAGAADAFRDMSTRIAAYSDVMVARWKQDWSTTTAQITALTSDTADKVNTSFDGITGHISKVDAAADTAALAIENTLAKFGQSVFDLLQKIPATEDAYLTALQTGGQKASQILSQINADILKATNDMTNMTLSAAQVQGLQNWIDELNKAKAVVEGWVQDEALMKLGDQITSLTNKFTVQVGEIDPAIQEWIHQIENFSGAMHAAADSADPAKLIQQLLETQKAFDDMSQSMAKSWEAGKDAQTTATTAMLTSLGAFRDTTVEEIMEIGKNWQDMATKVTTSGAQQAVVFEALKKFKIDDIGLLQQQAAGLQKVVQFMQAENAPLSEQLAIQAELLQTQIKIAEATGTSAQQTLVWTQQLTQVQIQQNLLKQDTIALSNLYTGMITAFGKAWDALGTGLADALVSGQNFGQALSKVFDDLKKQLAELVTNYLLGELKRAFLENTDAVNSFGKVFTSIFGGQSGGTSLIQSGMDSASKATADFSQVSVSYFGQAGDAVKSFGNTASSSMQAAATSVQSSAAKMITGLDAVATVVTAIASIFSAIELMHTNTLLDRIEHETARMAIYLGDQSQSILWSTQTSAAMLTYIHETIVQMSGDLQAIRSTLTSMLAVVAANGGGGGGGSANFAALQKEIADALAVFSSEIAGPYGLGAAVQGVSTGAAGLSQSFSVLSTAGATLGSTLTATSSTLGAAATGVVNSLNAVTKATNVPAAVAYAPGINTFVPIIPVSTAVPGVGSGPGGSASGGLLPMPQPGGAAFTVVTHIQAGVITGAFTNLQQLSDMVTKNVVQKLQNVAGQKLR